MKAILFLLALLLAAPVLAADGDACDRADESDRVARLDTGAHRYEVCIDICDGKAAADDDAACTEFDMRTVGRPDLIILEREQGPSCSDAGGPTFTVTTGPVTGGSPSYDIGGTAVVLNDTTDRVVIDMTTAPTNRYLFASLADAAACTEADLRAYFVTLKK